MQKKAKNIVKNMCVNALFASVYVVLVLVFGDLSFGFNNGLISIRIAEILVSLCCFDKRFIYGSIVSCLIANLFGGLPIDIIVGTIQTTCTACILYFIKNKQIAVFCGAMLCGVIIGLELYFLDLSVIGLWIILTTFIGEYIVLELGYVLFNKYDSVINMHKKR